MSLEEMKKDFERQEEIRAELLAKQPDLGISSFVISGDILSAEKADKLVQDGMPTEKALMFVGSYARFDWAVKNLPRPALLKMLPELWMGADPDDTNSEYLELWKEAWKLNGNKTVCDGKKLPRRKKLRVFRGQFKDAEVGFAWTLDVTIARKFALTGGLRGTIKNGIVYEDVVSPDNIYGYITGRGESEVITDPFEYRRWK